MIEDNTAMTRRAGVRRGVAVDEKPGSSEHIKARVRSQRHHARSERFVVVRLAYRPFALWDRALVPYILIGWLIFVRA